MPREVGPRQATFVDVLERVLAKGVVIDAQIEIAVAGITLIGVRAFVVVASLETYRKYSELLTLPAPAVTSLPLTLSRPPVKARAKRQVPARPRRAALVLTCDNGCTFRRPPARSGHADTVACPYRPGVVCSLRSASALS